MNDRRVLIYLSVIVAAAGLLLLGVLLVRSLSLNARQESNAWSKCDLTELAPGKISHCGKTAIYRRTEMDLQSVSKFENLLDDPNSIYSTQPATSKNVWRSENKLFFVFSPSAPNRGCSVELKEAGDFAKYWEPTEATALKDLPYFYEPCENRTWDASGRLYRRDGYPKELNLTVPKVRWVSKTQALIYRG